MKAILILAYPKEGSFNHAIADAAEERQAWLKDVKEIINQYFPSNFS